MAQAVPNHGQFRLGSFLLASDGLALLDWDTLCMAPREADAGRMLADLTRLRLRFPLAAAAMEQARADFLRGYEQEGPELASDALAAYESFWLLKDLMRDVTNKPARRWHVYAQALLQAVERLLAREPERGM